LSDHHPCHPRSFPTRRSSDLGIPEDWIDAARRSPIRALIDDYKVALPLHPEYRTMPMVWYIPPLSPVVDAVSETGEDGEGQENRSEEHTSELQSRFELVCRLL